MAQLHREFLQRAPAQTCGGKNNFSGGLVAYATGTSQAKAISNAQDYVKAKALDKYNQDIGRNCPGPCTLMDRDGSISPNDNANKPIAIRSHKLDASTWVAYAFSFYKVSVNCKGSRPSGRPTLSNSQNAQSLVYGPSTTKCGDDNGASRKSVYTGCAIGTAVKSSLSGAKTAAVAAAVKMANTDRNKILMTKGCPKKCSPGTGNLDPFAILGKAVQAVRVTQSKRTRYVAYAYAEWMATVTCH